MNKLKYMILIFYISILPNFVIGNETTDNSPSAKERQPDVPVDEFTPSTAKYSTSRNRAISYADPKWNALSLDSRAKYVKSVLEDLIAIKGYSYQDINSILCIINKESEYIPNRKTPIKGSTASGLGQVTNTTIKGLLKQKWFTPVDPDFTKALGHDAYRSKSAGSIVEQLNLIISTLHLKRVESKSKNMTTIIKRYRGDKRDSVNTAYANKVEKCRACIETSGITSKCLNKVK